LASAVKSFLVFFFGFLHLRGGSGESRVGGGGEEVQVYVWLMKVLLTILSGFSSFVVALLGIVGNGKQLGAKIVD
jgi:hypothetical protein